MKWLIAAAMWGMLPGYLLQGGTDRPTGWNSSQRSQESFPYHTKSLQLWLPGSCPVLCVYCVWSCSHLYGVSFILVFFPQVCDISVMGRRSQNERHADSIKLNGELNWGIQQTTTLIWHLRGSDFCFEIVYVERVHSFISRTHCFFTMTVSHVLQPITAAASRRQPVTTTRPSNASWSWEPSPGPFF